MLNFPTSTEFNRRIPKQKFYDNLSITPALKRSFIDDIKVIYWRNKLAESTLNIPAGKDVTEIEVFEIILNSQEIDEKVLRQIDSEIPYHILFILCYNSSYELWIGYKEARTEETFKVSGYYHTEWSEKEALNLDIVGLSLDEVYESFVRQIAGEKLKYSSSNEALADSVHRSEEIAQLEKLIAKTEAAAWKEQQPKKRFEIYTKLQDYKRNLEDLKNNKTEET
ncbi:MAG: DUF4391 domain-containing protein [Oscillospiraceae bacterium]|nr:DUF4391 domain-containing protein [Oscillospiraceae bacterium]